MGGTRNGPVSWDQLSKGQAIYFYTADGWKKGTIISVNPQSCSILWSIGSTEKTTTVFDLRNVRLP
jgi:hypothetical protein